MRWSEEQTVTFVKIYLEHDYLWNTNHKHYGLKYLRKKAYKDIRSRFEEATGIKLTEREVITKIKNLASTYTQELAKIKKRSESDNPYTPALRWFQYWHRCKIDNQPLDEISPASSEDQKMCSVLSDNDDNDPSVTTEKRGLSSNISKWSQDITHKFVKMYLQYEVLWNLNHKYYIKTKKPRREAYGSLCQQFKSETGIALTVTEAVIKVKRLKSTYNQELAKIKRLSNEYFTHVPKLVWFEDWDRCFNPAKYSNNEIHTEIPNVEDQKLWLEVSDDEDEDDFEPKQIKSEETITKTKWNEADTLKFVKIYLQYDFLYNPKHKYFRQKKLRTEGYISVSSEFEAVTGIKLDEKEIKAKIKSLQSTYCQELTKIKERSGTERPYMPAIKWFKYWHKYKYTMQQHNARSSANEAQESGEDWPISMFEEEEEQKLESDFGDSSHQQDSESECEEKKIKIVKCESQDDSDMCFINFVDTSLASTSEDEFEHYGKYIASVLRSMESDKAMQIQLAIQNLLSEA